jgi:hypothetical protein
MAEYLERKTLLDLAKKIADMYSPTGLAAPKIIRLIEKIKKADVVEVVRCKDCIYSTLYCGSYICDNIEAPWFNDEFTIDMMSNEFCSYGERKEGAEG